MTEFSYLFTTSGSPSGDQVAGYTQAHWSTIAKILSACSGFEGVGLGYLNELAGTVTGANTVSINTGGALVDGKPYNSDAAVEVNIPSAVGVGNTRIDRIVLRASWSAFTVRITRIAGTDAASPTAPAITQTPGTTYDIMLYQALVDTSGTVTLTDERTIDRDRLTHRQGGSASDWSSGGTTTYIPTAARMQAGAVTWTGGDVSYGTLDITYPVAFSNPPLVLAICIANNLVNCSVSFITATGATILWRTIDGSVSGVAKTFHWLAIGPV